MEKRFVTLTEAWFNSYCAALAGTSIDDAAQKAASAQDTDKAKRYVLEVVAVAERPVVKPIITPVEKR